MTKTTSDITLPAAGAFLTTATDHSNDKYVLFYRDNNAIYF